MRLSARSRVSSAGAGDGTDGRGQRIGWTPFEAVSCLHCETFPGPVLDAADHLLNSVSEPGKRERGAGGAIAARAPAISDDRDVDVEQFAGAVGDVGGWQMQCSRYVPLSPGILATRVEEDEVRQSGVEGGVYVGEVSLAGQSGGEE